MDLDFLDGPAAEVKFSDAEANARGEFVGYASVFGNTDLGGDIVERGAFSATLQARKSQDVAMLWGHDLRSVPIGKWVEMREDDRGLVVRGQLTLDIPRARDVHAALKEGTVKGLSIGYRIPPGGAEMANNGRVRRIKAVDLHEVSVVTFPMNQRAQVARVKGVEMTIREFEAFLRDEGGFSAAAAKAITARGYKAAGPRDEDVASELAAALRRNLAILKS
jgi:HK97 family phage prohead protease